MKKTSRSRNAGMISCKTRGSTGFLLFQWFCAGFRFVRGILVDAVVEEDAVEVVELMLEYHCKVSLCLDFDRPAVDRRCGDANPLITVDEPLIFLIDAEAALAARQVR